MSVAVKPIAPKEMFCKNDFQAIAEQLRSIKGAFILSINDAPPVRRIFHGFWMHECVTTYTVGREGKPRESRKSQEFLVSNRDLEERNYQTDIFG